MDALAALANTKLLPVINAVAANGVTVGGVFTSDINGANYYDKQAGGVIGGKLVTTQPNYSFTIPALTNLIPSGATYDGSGQYEITITTAGDYDLLVKDDIGFSINDSTTVDFYNDARSYYLSAGATVYVLGNSGDPVTAVITPAQGWLSEFNRIRADAMLLFNPSILDNALSGQLTDDTSGLFLNPSMVCSGPWCVGVNDVVTYPASVTYLQGSYLPDGTKQNSFCLFDAVQFYSADNTVQVNSVFEADALSFALKPSDSTNTSLSLDIHNPLAGNLNLVVSFVIHISSISGAAVPPASALDFTSSFGTLTLQSSGASDAYYLFSGTLAEAIAVGVTTLTWSFTVPPGCGTMVGGGARAYVSGRATVTPATITVTITPNGSNPTAAANGLNPSGQSYAATSVSLLGNYCWLDNSTTQFYLQPRFILTDPSVQGVWTAKTLPVPGNNVFLDADLPPYINGFLGTYYGHGFDNSNLTGNFNTAYFTGSAQSGLANDPQTTSVRAIAPLPQWNGAEYSPLVNGINGALPALQPQPSQWPVLRDTDVVPFDYGFNQFNSHETVTKVSGPFWGSVSFPPNATAVRLRIVQSGTGPGWYGGVFKYGLPLGEIVPIYIAASYAPTPTVYDATTNTNSFDADGDFSLSVITDNEGFSYYLNPADGVVYDVYIEVDFAPPQRNFFPPQSAECFSFTLDGVPALSQLITAGAGSEYNYPKPVPQSGYSIFKVRATRPAVAGAGSIYAIPAAGAEIVVTLGQNIITNGPPNPFQPPFGMGGGFGMGNGSGNGMGGQIGQQTLTFVPFTNPDGSPLTITIPATGSTTGDVSVFIPCVAGNELVWQAASDVRLEAWANWQPIWFNNVYAIGQFPINPLYDNAQSVPTIYPYALSFINSFYKNIFGWPSIGNGAVQLPWSAEIYNDLIEVLTLIP